MWSSWYASSFRGQFLKDLQKMTSLGSIKWVFKKTANVVPDLSALKKNVLSSLGTFDTNLGKWVPNQQFIDFINGPDVLSKMRLVFGDQIENAADILSALEKNNTFEMIFSISN